MSLLHTPLPTIGSDCEPYQFAEGEKPVANGYWSNSERDQAIRELQEQVKRLEARLAAAEKHAPIWMGR